MKTIHIITASELVDLARAFTEPPPEPVNDEYVRGQAELICDAACLSQDSWKEIVTRVISHRASVRQETLLSAVLGRPGELWTVPPADPAPPEPTFLKWHKGRHHWQTHDGYRRHAHSLNGVSTIDPHDTRVHLQGGIPFRNEPEARP
jgi:hypothetical protein